MIRNRIAEKVAAWVIIAGLLLRLLFWVFGIDMR
jgi:hypothetical protein